MGGGGLHTTPTPESEVQESQSPSVLEQSMALYVFLLHSSATYAQTYCTTDFHFVVLCPGKLQSLLFCKFEPVHISDRDRITMPPSRYLALYSLSSFSSYIRMVYKYCKNVVDCSVV